MKRFNTVHKLISLGLLLFISSMSIAQGRIAGVITDDAGEALIGANIIVQGTTEGTISDFDGSFSFNTSLAFPLTVVASYTGYSTQEIVLDGPTDALNVAMSEGVLLGGDVIISASRRREKVQEAPASVSVLSAAKIESSSNPTDPVRNLANVAGVQIQQQSANTINIEMRGSASLFSTSVFPIKDYRSLVGPGIGTFQSGAVGLSNIDLQRVEVVRGPGSALYGPGVTSGVVHFITKNPIDFPGTTIELIGGELSTYGAGIRHAGSNTNKTFGYKVNAAYRRGNEFKLDGSEGTTNGAGVFTSQLSKFQSTIYQPDVVNGTVNPATRGTPILELTPDENGNLMSDDWNSFTTDLTLEFRPADQLSFSVAGGVNKGKSVFYNSQGEGLFQQTELWTQARVQAGGLFAQAFYVTNDGGTQDNPTFLYQTGNRTPVGRDQFETQIQYNFDATPLLNSNWTVGVDYRLAIQDTENLVYGRNEDDDNYEIFGGYAQGKFELGSKLDLVLAGRYDQFNFVDEGRFSPRAALVLKASPQHTFRASYNQSSSAVTNLQLNIDFPVNIPVPGLFDVWLYGNKTPQTFTNPVIDVTIPGVPDLPVGTPGFPLDVAFGAVTPGVLAALGGALPPDQAQLLMQILGSTTPGGFSGNLVQFNLFTGQPLDLIDAPQAKLNITDTYEVGYKGLWGNKLGVSLDVYNNKSRNFSLFTAISPTVALANQNIAVDLGNAVQARYQPLIEQALIGAGLDAATAAATAAAYGAQLNGAYAQAGAQFVDQTSALYGIFGAIETDQVPQDDGIVHSAAGYRTFGEINYWGADLGLDFYINDVFALFANYSWLSENLFTGEALGEPENSNLSFALGAPANKYRIGATLTPEYGWKGSLSFQHDDSFFAEYGQYTGDTDVKNLVDMSVGYKFESGLALDLTATNLFDNEYRAFVNMPAIGRRILGKLTYTFGAEGPSDLDGDGIRDKKDACPNAAGTKEFQGCPDSDGDGIIDKDDNCPNAAGDILYGGCPDSDGDGVIDREDNCPNDAGDLGGCPDADGDGVADKDDNCPNSAGNLGGCPDADGDGVADKDDNCPNSAGPIGGCPDGDGDGVADKDDKCPRVAARTADGCPADPDGDGVAGNADKCPNDGGIVDADGCPLDSDGDGIVDNDDKCPSIGGVVGPDGCNLPVPVKAINVFERAIQGLSFQSGSSVITRRSYTVLDEIAVIMSEFPRLKLDIEGHTDSVGSDVINQKLSQKRAEAVQTYLINAGVSPSRLRAFGYGEIRPISDNDTTAGRAKNRRVDFVASF